MWHPLDCTKRCPPSVLRGRSARKIKGLPRMPINAHPDFLAAEKEHLLAQTSEDKIKTLEKMVSLAPKHKGAENLRAQLKTKLKN